MSTTPPPDGPDALLTVDLPHHPLEKLNNSAISGRRMLRPPNVCKGLTAATSIKPNAHRAPDGLTAPTPQGPPYPGPGFKVQGSTLKLPRSTFGARAQPHLTAPNRTQPHQD